MEYIVACVCVCVWVCVYIFICMCVWVCVYIFMCMCVYICVCVYVCIYLCVCVCMCVYIYVYVCVCVCVCMCMCMLLLQRRSCPRINIFPHLGPSRAITHFRCNSVLLDLHRSVKLDLRRIVVVRFGFRCKNWIFKQHPETLWVRKENHLIVFYPLFHAVFLHKLWQLFSSLRQKLLKMHHWCMTSLNVRDGQFSFSELPPCFCVITVRLARSATVLGKYTTGVMSRALLWVVRDKSVTERLTFVRRWQ